MKAHYYDLSIRVLIYKEDDQFVAHALELDILGYGDSEDEAKKELKDLVASQLSFASCVGKPDIVTFPAPKEFFARWEKANQAQLSAGRVSERSLAMRGKASVFVYAKDDLTKLRASGKRAFSKAADHQQLVEAA
jgi:hypothetical protein